MYEKGSGSSQGTTTDSSGSSRRTPSMNGREAECSKSVYGTRRSVVTVPGIHKLCRCGKGYCKVLTSTRDHSRGCRFYCCPQSTGADNHGCGMFEWVAEDGGAHTTSDGRIDADNRIVNPPRDTVCNSSGYAIGYLDGVIKGTEQQTDALKAVLAAIKKMELNQK